MPTGTVINGIEDFIAIALKILQEAQHELVFLIPPSLLSLTSVYDTVERSKRFIRSGGVVRGIIPISRANTEEMWKRLGVGEDLRHSGKVHELFMFIGDRQQSISAVNVGVNEFALGTPITAFWSEDPTYAEYLLTAFEVAWTQAVPAEERIQELLES